MADISSAATMVNYYTDHPPQIRGRTVYVQFSNHEQLKTEQSSQVPTVLQNSYLYAHKSLSSDPRLSCWGWRVLAVLKISLCTLPQETPLKNNFFLRVKSVVDWKVCHHYPVISNLTANPETILLHHNSICPHLVHYRMQVHRQRCRRLSSWCLRAAVSGAWTSPKPYYGSSLSTCSTPSR